PDALRSGDDLAGRCREMPDIGRTAALVADHAHFVTLAAEREHGTDEVLAGGPEEPRAPYDPARLDLPLPLEFRHPVRGERARLVRLHVRRPLVPVEDVIRREIHDRNAERDDVARALDVHPARAVRIRLGAVDIGPGRGVEHELRLARDGLGDVEPGGVRVWQDLAKRRTELPARPCYEDVLSRSERIGDWVLQRSRTRSSSQGIPCSSGSAGSYSSVTW